MKIISIIAKTCVILFLLVFCACQKEDDIPENPVIRTIIVYMAADNDLSFDAFENLQQMKKGFSETGTRLVVFLDQIDENPCLAEVHPGKDVIVKSYSELNSANPDVLREVIRDVIDLYPAQEYGLILWSHGTSWLPAGSTLRSFGNDNGKQMNIPDLAESLPVKFSFILFDACLMGAVEVAYELKDKTDYIIASSMETIADGFPYEQIIPQLIQPKIDFNAVAQSYFDYYNTQKNAYRSATVSVIETRYLPELAYSLKQLFESNPVNLQSFDRKSVQRLDIYGEQYVFDLSDFVDKVLPEANKDNFTAQLNRVVQYKNHTPQFLMKYDIKTYCGLSCYIPLSGRNDLNVYYKTLKWYRDAGLNNLF